MMQPPQHDASTFEARGVDDSPTMTRAINTSTYVNIGLLIVILGAVFSGAWWAAAMQTTYQSSNELTASQMKQMAEEHRHAVILLELKIEQVRSDIADKTHGNWRTDDMRAYAARSQQWVELLAARNLELDVPNYNPMPEGK